MIKGFGETINWDSGNFTWDDARRLIKKTGGEYVHLRKAYSFEIREEKFKAKVMALTLVILAIVVYIVYKNAPFYTAVPGSILGLSAIAMACRLYYGYKKRSEIKKDEEKRQIPYHFPYLKSLLLKDNIIINDNITVPQDRSKTRFNTSYKKPTIQTSPMAMSSIEMAEVKHLPGTVPDTQ